LLKPIAAPAPPAPDASSDASPGESSTQQLARLDLHVGEYQRQLATLDDQLRRAAAPLQPKELSACVEQLDAAHDQFLSQQTAVDQINLPIGASPELEEAHRRLATLWQQHCAEVGEAQRALGKFQPSDDLSTQRQSMIERNNTLLALGHELRDTLGETMAAMPRAEMNAVRQATPSAAGEAFIDRFQLDAFLAEWWTNHSDDQVPLSIAAVDVDELGRVNRECGPLAGDHVLEAIAHELANVCGKECRICHFSGDTFLIVMPNVGLHDATTSIEHARQQLEHTRFTKQDQSLQVTVSCGVTQTCPGDGTKPLLDRVAASLNEAKRYGHNRTFAHEGKYPTPVMPPSLEMSEKAVEL
jgi:diguanylate cyclase (GGDEF)-like protein